MISVSRNIYWRKSASATVLFAIVMAIGRPLRLWWNISLVTFLLPPPSERGEEQQEEQHAEESFLLVPAGVVPVSSSCSRTM